MKFMRLLTNIRSGVPVVENNKLVELLLVET